MQHVLITGAGGAIGAALARSMRARHPGACLSLVDVVQQPMEALAGELGGEYELLCWDLDELEALPGRVERLVERRGEIDALVNCAGFMEVRCFAGMPWEVGESLLRVDLLAPLRLMQLVLPAMQRRGRGQIVNISSMAGVTPLRGCSYYGAAKAGLAMASEIARMEQDVGAIQILTVYPGPVHSPLEARARGQYRDGLLQRLMPSGQPGALAEQIMEALDADRPRVVYPGLYALAERFRDVSRRVSMRWSPWPRG